MVDQLGDGPRGEVMHEPVLTADDRTAWNIWRSTALIHARTRLHALRVERARSLITEALTAAPRWCCMVSGGKDSSVMAALVADGAPGTQCASEKDDMDYPGEEPYVTDLCARFGLPLTILRPPVSPREVIAREASKVGVLGDWHGRSADLSRKCFYEVVEAHGENYDGIFLGLRSDESRARAINRATHGALYHKIPSKRHPTGQWVCCPLSDWRGIDVYAYCFMHDIPLLPVYQCIGLMHRAEPWRIRKSWWLPNGTSARYGDVAWLRRYYPSLYRQLCEWMPDAQSLT